MTLRTDYAPVEAWVAIVRELVGRGVADVPVLVFTLTYRDIVLRSDGKVEPWERLLRAMPTVASALGLQVQDVQQQVVGRAASPDTEPGLRAACKAIEDKLQGLPGVVRIGPLDFGRYPLTGQFQRMAQARNIPLPKLAPPSLEWLELLRALKSSGTDDALVLHLAATGNRVTLTSGRTVEPIRGETLDETLADLLASSAVQVHGQVEASTIRHISELDALRDRARELLQSLSGVAGVEPARASFPNRATLEYEGPALDPPWTQFPEPPDSMRWRMGPGEDFKTRWWWFFESLSSAERAAYFTKWRPPAEWREWVERALEKSIG